MLIRNSTFPGRLQGDKWEPAKPAPPQPLLAEIDAFMARHNMSWSAFSRDMANDYHLLHERLSNGQRVFPSTEKRVREAMARYDRVPK